MLSPSPLKLIPTPYVVMVKVLLVVNLTSLISTLTTSSRDNKAKLEFIESAYSRVIPDSVI